MPILKHPETVIQATHVLFDMDGLLLNTEHLYWVASNTIAQRFGKTYEWTLKAKLMGLREDDAAELFIKEMDIPMTAAEFLVERKRLHAELFPNCVPLPGVVEFVSHLHNVGMPMAVCTSSHRKPFELKSAHNQHLFKLFRENITTGDDPSIRKGKPAPDLFLAGHKQLGRSEADIATAVVFEDAISGVQAGLNAGMHVVWVRDARLQRGAAEIELESKCFAVLESMTEFDPEWIGVSPMLRN
ncbi:haloacid dehalogenase superfamily protein, subfamily IA, variant 3 with third motif having DD or ED [Catenaria anguillulae PL171]|uniref:Haloacid dehalogenase superfamily protein, subfamily IA, variant 3 with third motif having DD or ED n=1 Tax=Catenaria anguillulae PL171 TaxID=765915 RepID=A0A1Y2HVH9_9FUNG|nr:haloacid dehalogenase superfamily protein, subfamily IA, variant 3 with third motif having DD or ED [Catenaria anguillulae PL171]